MTNIPSPSSPSSSASSASLASATSSAPDTPNTLIMRLQAPLMSFGAPLVDHFGFIQEFPALSLLAGLFGNALGYDHTDFAALQHLQASLRYAVRRDQTPIPLQDYQTVDLGQPFLRDHLAWTTFGELERRGGAKATNTGTHIRYRDYHADGAYLLAVQVAAPMQVTAQAESGQLAQPIQLAHLAQALQTPARPLFIGRKPCIPSAPLFVRLALYPSLYQALCQEKLLRPSPAPARYKAWWPAEEGAGATPTQTRLLHVTDQRDWQNQIHVGKRVMYEGFVSL